MASLSVGRGVMAAVLVVVVVVASGTTTTGVPTQCLNATQLLARTVNESDACIWGRIQEETDATNLYVVHSGTVFCSQMSRCLHAFEDIQVPKDGGCIIPQASREKYFFFGRFLNDQLTEVVLTASPLPYDNEKRKEIRNIYASKVKLNQPSVEVDGAWQKDNASSGDPVVYYVLEGTNVTMKCFYPFQEKPHHLQLEWNVTLQTASNHDTVRDFLEISNTYTIENATLQDSGTYACHSKFYKKLSEPYEVNITVIGVSTQEKKKQHDVNYAFFKIFEPLREFGLLEKARTFNPVADVSMYKDGGVAVQHLMDELTHHRLLEKKHWAVASNKRHLEEAIMLFEVLMQCKDWNCVASNGAYFRERVNEEEFIYAVYHAVKHSPLTQHVVLPAIYEVKPHHFTKSQVMEEAYQAKELNLNKVFQNNFTGTPNDIEHKVAYFREDIGIATHHLMFHLENPSWWKDTYGYHIDRKGENFFYAYHQLLNRYEAERISNHLPPLEELKLDEPLKEGFAPQTTYKFGPPFPTRNDDMQLRDVDKVGRIHEIVHMEDRIHDAIAHGYVEDEQGNKISIENDDGTDVLGGIIQSSLYSPNRKYYGSLTTLAYTLLDHQTDPKNKYGTPPGVLAHLETLPRDPAAWRLHKRIDNIFRKHIDSLPPYTKDDLEFTGITVSDIKIEENLETYFEEYKYDLSNAFNDNTTSARFHGIYATMPRLNHKEFSYKIKVNNSNGDPKKSVIRILAMPYRDGNGAIIPFDEGRWLAIEMDLFVTTLTQGDNEIDRKSSEASITVPDVLTYEDLATKTEAHENLRKHKSATGIPNRLLLPKGSDEGTEFRLIVAVTDAEQDVNDETIITMETYHHYGVRGVQPDNRPFGYPLDRRVPQEHVIHEVTNIKEIMVEVYNHNVFVPLPQQ